MIDDRYITEAKRNLQADTIATAEARNRQGYAASNKQTRLTVYELLCLAEQENTRLREENERLRKDAEVGAAIERAARDLPVGDMIEISVKNGSVVADIYYYIGGWDTMDVDNGNRLADGINAAIAAARGEK